MLYSLPAASSGNRPDILRTEPEKGVWRVSRWGSVKSYCISLQAWTGISLQTNTIWTGCFRSFSVQRQGMLRLFQNRKRGQRKRSIHQQGYRPVRYGLEKERSQEHPARRGRRSAPHFPQGKAGGRHHHHPCAKIAGERHSSVSKQCSFNRPDAEERSSFQSVCRTPLRNEGDSRDRLTICRASPIMLLTQGREPVPGAYASREPSVGARRRRNAGEYVPERGPQRRLAE